MEKKHKENATAKGPYVPMRKCIGCGNPAPKRELIRIIQDQNGQLLLDETGKANGRGVYLCRNATCFAAARKKNLFRKNLRAEIPDQVIEALSKEFEELLHGN